MYLSLLKMESQINQKKVMISLLILKPLLRFLCHKGKYGCIFFAAHRTVFSQYIKIDKLTFHNSS